jgi:hypothetical protein
MLSMNRPGDNWQPSRKDRKMMFSPILRKENWDKEDKNTQESWDSHRILSSLFYSLLGNTTSAVYAAL